MMKNSIPKNTEALISEAEKSNQLTKFHEKNKKKDNFNHFY